MRAENGFESRVLTRPALRCLAFAALLLVTAPALAAGPAITEGPGPIDVSMSEDGDPTPFSLTLHATDVEDPGDSLTWSISSPASHGAAVASGAGASKTISYTPDADYFGFDSFDVTVTDTDSNTDTVTINVNIQAVNDPPQFAAGAGPVPVTIDEDNAPMAFSLSLTVSDVEDPGSALTWSISTPASHGTAGASGTGAAKALSYTPDQDYNGSDSFSVAVTDSGGASSTIAIDITINPQADAPAIAQGPGPLAVIMDEDAYPVPFSLSLDASDPEDDDDTLAWSISSPAQFGLAGVTGTGASKLISYLPVQDYNGVDSFDVTVTDSEAMTDTVTVNVTINPVNDAPVLDNGGLMTFTSIAEDNGSSSGDAVSALIASAGGDRITDVDVGALEGMAVYEADTANGSWQFSTNSGASWSNFPSVSMSSALLLEPASRIRFLPAQDYNGTVDPAIAFAAWDQTSGTVGETAGISDRGGITAFSNDTETAAMTVTPVNDPPVAPDFSVSTNEDTVLTIELLNYVSDVDSSLGTPWNQSPPEGNVAVQVTQGTLGSVNINVLTGQLIYTPRSDLNGPDSFSYRITDGYLADKGSVTVDVVPVNDPPFAEGDSVSYSPGQPQIIINVLANDEDTDGALDPSSVIIVPGHEPVYGQTSIDPGTGAIAYALNPDVPDDFAGTDVFTYQVCDDGPGTPLCASAAVTILISPLSLTVDSLLDEQDGNISAGRLSLREAVALVAAGGVIYFDPALFATGPQTISLDSTGGLSALVIDKDLTIVGPGADMLFISGNDATRVFDIVQGAAAMQGLTIVSGHVVDEQGAGVRVALGAGLALYACGIADNAATDGNSVPDDLGAGIHSVGALVLVSCTVHGNTADTSGGGIYSTGLVELVNATISGNAAVHADGGGVWLGEGEAAIVNSTITHNTAVGGGGVNFEEAGAVSMANSIVAGNEADGAPDVQGIAASNGHNIIGNAESTGDSFAADVVGIEAEVLVAMTLASNGGSLPTHALLADSIAIDGGDATAIPAGLAVDGRGFGYDRFVGPAVDIGAYEVRQFIVNTLLDTYDIDAGGVDASPETLSLREAVALTLAGDRIAFDESIVGGGIALDPGLGPLVISSNLGVFGPGADQLAVDGGGATQLVYVPAVDADVVLTGLAFQNGHDAVRGGGALYSFGTLRISDCVLSNNIAEGYDGGAIHNRGRLTLTRCVLGSNSADNLGGALVNWAGHATLDACSLADNFAGDSGGAVYNLLSGTLRLVSCTVSGNQAASNGGGLYNAAHCVLNLQRSALLDNEAGADAGGLANLGTLSMTNCTLSSNVAGRNGGGLLEAGGAAHVVNCTIAYNLADAIGNGFADGGGISQTGGSLSLHNTIVAGNYDTLDNAGAGNIRPDVAGAVLSLGSNLIGISNGISGLTNGILGDQAGTGALPLDPLLVALDYNGGLTPTHMLMVQSPAIDGGDSGAVAEPLFIGPPYHDQRGSGFDRIVDGNGNGQAEADIGAFEFRSTAPQFASTPVLEAVEDDPYSYAISIDDIDPGDIFTIAAATLPTWLELVDNGDGTAVLSGTPRNENLAPDYDQATHEVVLEVRDWAHETASQSFTINVTGVNDAPTAMNDAANTDEDQSVNVDVLANDADVDGSLAPASVFVVAGPDNGSASTDPATGAVTYTPSLDFNGVDSFTYQVWDDGTPMPALSGTATVTVTVEAVNDPPVARPDLVTVYEDGTVDIPVLLNDSDVDGQLDPGQLFVPGLPSRGTALVNANTGVINYTPNADFYGTDRFTYRVFDTGTPTPTLSADAQVEVQVLPVNDPPRTANDAVATPEDTALVIEVLANDFDIDGALMPSSVTVIGEPGHGSVTVDPTTGAITYLPAPDFHGLDVFTYRVTDDGTPLPGQSGTAEVAVTVAAVNDPPDAQDDEAYTRPATRVIIDVLRNDRDVDGQLVPGSVRVGPGPAQGTAEVATLTGAIVYTPRQGFAGVDVFTYQVADDGAPLPAKTSTAIVRVTVNNPAAPPSTFYVSERNPRSGTGALDDPFQTIGQAVAATQGLRGDRIIVRPGVYMERILLKAGTVLCSTAGPFRTVLFPRYSDEEALTLNDGCTVRGLSVSGAASGIGLAAGASGEITNCAVYDCVVGVLASPESRLTLANNVLAGNSVYGAQVTEAAVLVSAANNLFAANQTALSAPVALVEDGGYNGFQDNTADYEGLDPFATDVALDPLFVDAAAANFHLAMASAARDAGDPRSAYLDPDGSRNDLGMDGGPHAVVDTVLPKAEIITTPAPPWGPSPLLVQFDASASTDEWGIASYAWDFDALDGVEAEETGVVAQRLFELNGTYEVTLLVMDNSGFVNTRTVEVRIGAPPFAELIATPMAGPVPLTVQFDANAFDPQGGPLRFRWDFGDGGPPISTGATPRHTYGEGLVPGAYEALVTVAAEADVTASSYAPITLTAQPVAGAGRISAVAGGAVHVDAPGTPLDGMTVEVPPGALARDLALAVCHAPNPPASANLALVAAFELVPADVAFSLPATVLVPLPDWLPSHAHVAVGYYHEVEGKWTAAGIQDVCRLDLDGGRVVAFDVTHLTYFAVVSLPRPDVNDDGTVDAVDVQTVVNAALGLDVSPANADVQPDGAINAVDVQMVVNAALGLYAQPFED